MSGRSWSTRTTFRALRIVRHVITSGPRTAGRGPRIEMSEINFQKFRARVEGDRYWRSLEELARSDDFEKVMADEFPQQALPLERGVDRRDFVKLMGASVALAGMAACNRPAEKIVPYVNQPENLIPGQPLFF